MVKIDTKTIKEISKWMMVIGGSIFTAGAGANLVCRGIEKREAKATHAADLLELETQKKIKQDALELEAIEAKAERDRVYTAKIESMDSKAFAKFHAAETAKADAAVMANANEIKLKAESELLKTKMDCTAEIDKIRRECLEKIEAANNARDEAVAKYEQIDNLFTNKKEILKAQEELKAAVVSNQKAKENKEELLKSFEELLK